jgi:hypothetical protein
VLAGLFVWVASDLSAARRRKGDIYPPYCSLSASPSGTRALHDALAQSGQAAVFRAFRGFDKVKVGKNAAFLMLGVDGGSRWSEAEVEALEAFMKQGGRLVIACKGNPLNERLWTGGESIAAQQKRWRERWKTTPISGADQPESGSNPTLPPAQPATPPHDGPDWGGPAKGAPLLAVAERFGFGFKNKAVPAATPATSVTPPTTPSAPPATPPATVRVNSPGQPKEPGKVERKAELSVEPSVAWNGEVRLAFAEKQAWTALYCYADGEPAIAERVVAGGGSLVVVAESYLFSNEGLQRHRAPQLLAWIVGGRPEVWFSEAIRGVEENPSFGTLARKYGLGVAAVVLAVLALLFVWRQSTSLVPPYASADEESAHVTVGRDATAGFQSLLRQAIPANQLLAVCVEEWRRAFGRDGTMTSKRKAFESVAAEELAQSTEPRRLQKAWSRLTYALQSRFATNPNAISPKPLS